VALVGGNQVSGKIAGRWRIESHLLLALGLALAGAFALLAVALTGLGGIPAAIGSIIIMVFGVGMSLPLASSITMGGYPERADAASALLGLLQFSMGGLVAPVVGVLGTGPSFLLRRR
jgi:DHA1 family bicyclomycin/chloramphenicol resistance-like MFS transporter